MFPKPPFTRTGRSGWLGHGATRLKSLAVVGTVMLGFAGAALAAAAPASADPTFQFIQVGSDTIEFTMDAFANTIGDGIIGEYDAVNPLTTAPGETITPQLAGTTDTNYTSCSFTRPNGSGGGFKAMAYAYTVGSGAGVTTLGQSGTPPEAGCVNISRSSSAPGSVSSTAGTPGALLTTGNFVYVPFAIDAVTYATGSTTPISTTTLCVASTTGCTNVTNGFGSITFTTTPTTIPQGMDLTVAQLQTLYKTCAPLTVGSTTLNPGTSFTYTSTAASPAVFTTGTSSNLTAGEEVTLSGTAPGGFTAGTPYFVASTPAPTATTFSLAATSGGAAIAGTSAGSGTVTTVGNIDLYAPQNGSGTLAFWELTMGVSAPLSCWHQTIVAGPAISVPVEEHDGTALASDPNGIAPISIARYVAASTGASPDLRHGLVLQAVTAGGVVVQPLNSSNTMNVAGCVTGSGFNQATCFPITRELYNVMDYYEITNTAPPSGSVGNPAFNSELAGLFAGSSSVLCRQTFLIQQQGFATITANANFPDQCGATTSGLRVQMNNSSAQG
jgi:hypothetical protein